MLQSAKNYNKGQVGTTLVSLRSLMKIYEDSYQGLTQLSATTHCPFLHIGCRKKNNNIVPDEHMINILIYVLAVFMCFVTCLSNLTFYFLFSFYSLSGVHGSPQVFSFQHRHILIDCLLEYNKNIMPKQIWRTGFSAVTQN